jgi:hypothetical protein
MQRRTRQKHDGTACPHPPPRLYAWHAYNPQTNACDWLCIGCCACGTILQGDQVPWETEPNAPVLPQASTLGEED